MSTAADSIGIDGGGTTCRVALVWRGQRFDASSGPANVTSDRVGALDSIRVGLAGVADLAGVSGDDLRALPAYAGLAGVTGPAVARAVADALPLTRLRIEDDRPATVRGSLGTADGAVAGIGTGSFAVVQQNGAQRCGGGYGLILGDEASGAWLGREVLARTLQVADGLRPASALTDRILSAQDTEEIVQFAARATPRDFARRAGDVVAAAARKDSVALELMKEGAGYIAALLAALGWRQDTPLCLLGGLGPMYARYLPATVRARVTPPLGTALDGALALAAECSA